MPYKSMKMMVDNVELRSQLQQNASQWLFRYEQQLVWDAILQNIEI
jgi:hypothetical protein